MRPHQFDLNLLRALDALLRERHVTRAAECVHITQQAMSGALKRLRAHFGDDLLRRSGQQLRLTPQGEALVEPVRETIRNIEQMLELRPTFDAATTKSQFTVAMSDYATLTVLPAVMATLMARAPKMVLEVKLIDERTVADLEAGKLDLCLLPSDWSLVADRTPRDVKSLPLYEDDFVCVVGKSNQAVDAAITVDEYISAPHVVLRLGHGATSIIEASWRKLGIEPQIAATATNFSAMVFMVVEAPIVATVQRRLARQFARMLPVKVLDCPVQIDPLHGNMSWPSFRDTDPAHTFLRQIFSSAAKN